MGIGELWTFLFLEPMLNALVLLYNLLGSNFALTIVAFTLIVRSLMLPLTLKQLRASKSMTALQPKIQELNKRYGKNREELSKATMQLYKEHGVNPIGCAVPTLLQFPIWIGLYQSITFAMADRPDNLYELGKHLYSWLPTATQVIPIKNEFLWLNLAHPDFLYILPVLVAGSTWIQQKMMTMPSTDPQQQQMNQMMGVMMPLMMGFFTINFPSGLALYWLTSNIYSVVSQFFITGWGTLHIPGVTDRFAAPGKPFTLAPATAALAPKAPASSGDNAKNNSVLNAPAPLSRSTNGNGKRPSRRARGGPHRN